MTLMAGDMTLAELQRLVESHDRRFNDYVRKAEHELVVRNIEGDVADIKDSQKWMVRLLAANFLVVIIALVLFLVERTAQT